MAAKSVKALALTSVGRTEILMAALMASLMDVTKVHSMAVLKE